MKRWYQILGFAVSVLIFAWVVSKAFGDIDIVEFLGKIHGPALLLNIGVGMLVFFATGLLMKTVFAHHFKVNLSWADTWFLPTMMHLWSYILPVKGGMIFQVVFMRAKYQVNLSKGFSVGVLIFAVSLFVTCLLGSLLAFQVPDAFSLQLILLAMGLMLIVPVVAIKLFPKWEPKETSPFYQLLKFGANVVSQLRTQTADRALLLKTLLVTIVAAVLHAYWFYNSALLLGYDPDPYGIALATLVLRIILLFRFLPGNLGIQEVITGAIFTAAGLGLQEGLMTAVFIRLASAGLAVAFGLPALYFNLRYFEANSIRGIWNKLKKQNSTEA